MIPLSTAYQAYCLECCGGGKELGRPSNKKRASFEATSHIKAFGHKVTMLYQPHAMDQTIPVASP